jgi:hypothetical protein
MVHWWGSNSAVDLTPLLRRVKVEKDLKSQAVLFIFIVIAVQIRQDFCRIGLIS